MTKVEEKIKNDLRQALLKKDSAKVEALRYLLSLIQKQALRQPSGKLDGTAAMAVLQKELKAKNEALAMFRKSGRQDLIAKEEAEIAILQKYLPAALSSEEIKKIIAEEFSNGHKDFGSLMGAVMARVKGRANGRAVAELIKETLEQ